MKPEKYRTLSLTFDTDLDLFAEPVVKKNTVFTLNLMAEEDIEFKVEVQILNGLFVADMLMFERSATLEILRPRRAETGTTKSFVAEIPATFEIELPYNMPLVRVAAEEGDPIPVQFFFMPYKNFPCGPYFNWLPVERSAADDQTMKKYWL